MTRVSQEAEPAPICDGKADWISAHRQVVCGRASWEAGSKDGGYGACETGGTLDLVQHAA